MIPAYAYLRVSGLTQAEESKDGLPRQLEAVKTFAAAKGYEIVKVYQEEGIPGKTDLENRPALRQLLSELGQVVNVVIIEKVDRLARFLMTQESIIADFARRHVTLVSTCEPDLCSEDPTRILFRQIMGAFSQYERSLIVHRLKAGADRARAAGKKWGGRHRYGRTEEEKSIVARVRDLDVQGLTLTDIAETLNRDGFKPRSGQKWYPMQISRILNQEETC
jgi:DNA invertase Pin-like site-specific DNA recombinase